MALLEPLSQEPEFCWTCGFHRMLADNYDYRFKLFADKTKDSIFIENPKTLF